MYFKLKSKIIFRNYGSFGYLTDNRNYGYQLANYDEKNDIGDKIVSQSGALFISVLEEEPLFLNEIAKRICSHFVDGDFDTIAIDVRDFFCSLEEDGFIVSGETEQECIENDLGRIYKKTEQRREKNNPCSYEKSEKDTQDFFEEYFNYEPQLTNIHVEITSKCNERCVHCYFPHDYSENHIETDVFYDILEQCKKMNVLHVTLSGGEPMMHNDFNDFLIKCREANFSVNVLSNLTLLDNDILEEMKKNRLLGVQVSLYSMDAKIHDEITQVKGSFEKTKNAILTLIENDIPLQISCPIIKQNIDSYKEVIDWGNELNIHVNSDFVILASFNHATQNLENRLSIIDVKKIIKQKIIIDSDYLAQIIKDAESKKYEDSNDNVCSICRSSICISEKGNVYPCAGWQDYVIGNITKTSLKDIWDNSKEIQFLRNLKKKDFHKCIDCPDNDFCTMCMVRNANENPSGNPLVVNEYFCNLAKATKEIVLKH